MEASPLAPKVLKRETRNEADLRLNVTRGCAKATVRATNGRNNFQHCWPNNVGNCCVRVGSGVHRDVTTPNNVGTCSASWEGYNPEDFGDHV